MTDFIHFTLHWEALIERLTVPALVIISALIVGIALNKLINRRIDKHLDIDEGSVQYVFIRALRGVPISWCLGVGIYWAIDMTELSPTIVKLLSYLLFAVIITTVTRVIARTLIGFIEIHMERDPSLPRTSLLSNLINIIIHAMGILVILQYYGISIAPILTALGVGGMAVALGLQETLANIFAGLHLILSKKLRIGDFIKLSSGEEGNITDIAWRYTTLRTLTGNAIVVPNQKISADTLTNYDLLQHGVMIPVSVGVSYNSDLAQVERVALEVARDAMLSIDKAIVVEPAVRFTAFGESSIDFTASLYTPNVPNQSLVRHTFIKNLSARFREEGIDIPYPIRTILKP
ncbi:mechanosensitive ion channel family protein [Selenomonas sp. TAMA-11512]|uniref:mechanosensitive ion channel family protein n=1 Tax=Selenomonas sp. TAMA-11512 TaxID=3095337 RepID=UPI0030924D7C|nr:mechanosensitive ion channel family protein [Selenomonas sp. TAMA-11512]